jgi:hypothetical protein
MTTLNVDNIDTTNDRPIAEIQRCGATESEFEQIRILSSELNSALKPWDAIVHMLLQLPEDSEERLLIESLPERIAKGALDLAISSSDNDAGKFRENLIAVINFSRLISVKDIKKWKSDRSRLGGKKSGKTRAESIQERDKRIYQAYIREKTNSSIQEKAIIFNLTTQFDISKATIYRILKTQSKK